MSSNYFEGVFVLMVLNQYGKGYPMHFIATSIREYYKENFSEQITVKEAKSIAEQIIFEELMDYKKTKVNVSRF